MQITLNIPTDQTTRVVDAICLVFGYLETLEDGTPNLETKAQFARRMVIQFVKNCVATAEAQQAAEAARQAAIADAQAIEVS